VGARDGEALGACDGAANEGKALGASDGDMLGASERDSMGICVGACMAPIPWSAWGALTVRHERNAVAALLQGGHTALGHLVHGTHARVQLRLQAALVLLPPRRCACVRCGGPPLAPQVLRSLQMHRAVNTSVAVSRVSPCESMRSARLLFRAQLRTALLHDYLNLNVPLSSEEDRCFSGGWEACSESSCMVSLRTHAHTPDGGADGVHVHLLWSF
jgi:hypothetical protein